MSRPALVPTILLAVTVALFWGYVGETAAVLAFVSHLCCWSLARHWGAGPVSSPSPSAPRRAAVD